MLFAGTTVVISLLGMLIMQLSFVSGLAIGAAVVVLMTLIASLTLLPALLGFAGSRIELTRWRGLIAAGLVALALIGVGLGIPALIVVTLPWLSSCCWPASRSPRCASRCSSASASRCGRRSPTAGAGSSSTGRGPRSSSAWPSWCPSPCRSSACGSVSRTRATTPSDTTTRKAYDLLAEGFGPGFNGALILASEVPEGTDPAALQAVSDAIQADPGVARVSPPITNDEAAPTAALWRVTPTTAPQDAETTDLVNRLRDDVLPAATDGTGLDVAVAGGVAIGVDFTNYLAERLPWFFAAVLGLSFLLLMTVFRSLLVPLKAVIMNLLSIGAAYGITVAVFQWGWGGRPRCSTSSRPRSSPSSP